MLHLVSTQIAFGLKGLAAVGTHEQSVLGVELLVVLQASLLGEALSAERADKRSLLSGLVQSLVSHQVPFLRKRLAADVTDVRPLTRVQAQVLRVTAFPDELLAA